MVQLPRTGMSQENYTNKILLALSPNEDEASALNSAFSVGNKELTPLTYEETSSHNRACR
jgi:hypothetical protein